MATGTTYYRADDKNLMRNKHFRYWKRGGTTLVPQSRKG